MTTKYEYKDMLVGPEGVAIIANREARDGWRLIALGSGLHHNRVAFVAVFEREVSDAWQTATHVV